MLFVLLAVRLVLLVAMVWGIWWLEEVWNVWPVRMLSYAVTGMAAATVFISILGLVASKR